MRTLGVLRFQLCPLGIAIVEAVAIAAALMVATTATTTVVAVAVTAFRAITTMLAAVTTLFVAVAALLVALTAFRAVTTLLIALTAFRAVTTLLIAVRPVGGRARIGSATLRALKRCARFGARFGFNNFGRGGGNLVFWAFVGMHGRGFGVGGTSLVVDGRLPVSGQADADQTNKG